MSLFGMRPRYTGDNTGDQAVFETAQDHPLHGRLRARLLHSEEGHTVIEVVAADRGEASQLVCVEQRLRDALPSDGWNLFGHAPFSQGQVQAALGVVEGLSAECKTVSSPGSCTAASNTTWPAKEAEAMQRLA